MSSRIRRKKTSGSGEKPRRRSESGEPEYVLQLFIVDMTPKSRLALDNINGICEDMLRGRCELQVVDIYEQPELARSEELVATPTLIKRLPLPKRRIIGTMSDTERTLAALDIVPPNVRRLSK